MSREQHDLTEGEDLRMATWLILLIAVLVAVVVALAALAYFLA